MLLIFLENVKFQLSGLEEVFHPTGIHSLDGILETCSSIASNKIENQKNFYHNQYYCYRKLYIIRVLSSCTVENRIISHKLNNIMHTPTVFYIWNVYKAFRHTWVSNSNSLLLIIKLQHFWLHLKHLAFLLLYFLPFNLCE